MASGKKLSPMQSLFAKEYIIDLNATRAAIRAGYSHKAASEQGYELLKNPKIQEVIQQHMDQRAKRTEVTADMVLQRIWDIVSVDLKDAYDDQGQLLRVPEMPEGVRKALVGIEVSEDYSEGVNIGRTSKVKFNDRLKAIELYGRHLKLFTDKLEHSGEIGLAEQLKKARERVKKDKET